MAYTRKDWNTDDVIDETSLDNIELGVEANDKKNTEQDEKLSSLEQKDTSLEGRVQAVEQKLSEATSSKAGLMSASDKEKLDAIEKGANKYVLPAATTGAIGGVKQSANVPKAASETPTKEEFDALIDALIATGIIAEA